MKSGCCGEEKNLLHCQELNLESSVVQPSLDTDYVILAPLAVLLCSRYSGEEEVYFYSVYFSVWATLTLCSSAVTFGLM